MNKYLYLYFLFISFNNIVGQTNNIQSPLTINDAVEIAFKTNPQIKSALSKIDAINGKYWTSISFPTPTISVNYEFIPIKSNFKNFGERTFEINQAFNFPSYYFLRGSKISTEKDISEIEYKMLIFNITNQVKSAYLNVLAKTELFSISKENLIIAEDFLHKAEIRHNSGEGTNLELLTAKVQFSESKNSLESARNLLTSSFSDLSYAMGYDTKSQKKDIVLKDSLEFIRYKFTLIEIMDAALSNNYQLKINKLNVDNFLIEKALAWSSILPNFSVSYYKQFRDGNPDFYGASFGISVPLWFLFDQRGQIQEASANHRSAEAEYESNTNLIYLRVNTAYFEFKDAEREVILYRSDIIPQSNEVYRSAIASYEAGLITYLEFLQAKQILISSKSNYINALLKYQLSLIKLEESIGQSLNKYKI